MDIITHLASGAVVAQALRQPQDGRWLLLFGMLAAAAPDLDNFSSYFGAEAYMRHHRGLLHSVLVGFLLAALLSGLFTLVNKRVPFKRGWLLAYLCLTLHSVLDLFTFYGTQLLAPLSTRRFAFDIMFIIDPIYALGLIVVIAGTLRFARLRRKIALAGVFWLGAYPAMNLGLEVGVQAYAAGQLRAQKMPVKSVQAGTDLLAPFFWKITVDAGDAYQVAGFSLFHPHAPLTFTAYQKADMRLLENLARSASLFQTYLWFAEHPVMTAASVQENGETQITFSDVRFVFTNPYIPRSPGNPPIPFSVTAVFAANQRLTGYIAHLPKGAEVHHVF